MNLNKESELINAIIVYFHRCQEEGDYSALQEMGFGPSESSRPEFSIFGGQTSA